MDRKGNLEDLVAWQKAKELATTAYQLAKETAISGDSFLKEKLIRSSMSVPVGLARSYGIKRRDEALDSLYEARAGLYEYKTTLAISADLSLIDTEKVSELTPLIDHTDKLISGLIQYKEDARNGKSTRRRFQGAENENYNDTEVNGNSNFSNSSITNY
jgi:four helix bundle protein